MALVTIRDLSIGFRGPVLLDGVNCQIESGRRIGLLGRNGSGKTTLMRILCGDVEPDSGEVVLAPGCRVSLLPQDVPQDLHGTISGIVATGLDRSEKENLPSWQDQQSVEQILSRMQLEGSEPFEILSSGMKRRVLLARAIVSKPDLLLLDEPTNHLDIDAIAWLEGFLTRWSTSLIFVTHDRMFLRNLSQRILEIDRGRLFDWSCDYDTFLKRKEAALAAEEKQNALFDKKLAQEEVWIRRGIKARRTRNEGRVRALKQLREERSQRRSSQGNVKIEIQQGQRSGNLVVEVKGISFAFDDREIIRNFSTTIMRGDKIGVIGPNGVGKTTLLRILLGELSAQVGEVKLGTNLQIAYFDQLRDQLDDQQTVQENVGDGYDSIQIGGKSQHILGYLQNFLFPPERARTPIRFLSGGERNRVLLAKLFAKAANVIVLDEPTNDLDTETLELLEDRLTQYEGTVLLVSHDRAFLNNVVTSTLVFENDDVKEYVGGYDDWLRQRTKNLSDSSVSKKNAKDKRAASTEAVKQRPRRLSYQEKQEIESLPAKVEKLEEEIDGLHQTMARPDFYQQPGEEIAREQANLQDLENRLAAAYQRWQDLEQFSSS